MQQIQKNIKKINQQFLKAEEYNNRLESIARMTNWHEAKTKFDKSIQQKTLQKKVNEELKYSLQELKVRRNYRLKELYEKEAKEYEQELAKKGLAIYKIKI